MNILMLSDAYFPRVNGVATSIQSFARALKRLGHTVTLIAPEYPADGPYPSYRDDEEGFTILRIPSRAIPGYAADRFMSYRHLMRRVPELKPLKFDILHIQTPFVAHYAGLKLARRLGIPVIESYHTFFEEYFHLYMPGLPSSWCRGLARALSRRQCNAVDRVIVPSHATKAVLQGYGVRVPIETLATGVDINEFAQGDGGLFRRAHRIDQDVPLLVHVSRVAFEKNIDFILRMFKTLLRREPRACLAICGEGPALEAMNDLAVRLGVRDNVKFVGFLERKTELMDAYRAADVFVFASRTETQGLVLLEALALGVPVVSTAVFGVREVLRDGAGALIAPENETVFAARVMELLNDPQRRHHLALAAKDYARLWTASSKAAELGSIYRSTINEAGIAQAGYGGAVGATSMNRS